MFIVVYQALLHWPECKDLDFPALIKPTIRTIMIQWKYLKFHRQEVPAGGCRGTGPDMIVLFFLVKLSSMKEVMLKAFVS